MAQLRMNITINIQFSANVLLLTIFALFAYSCTKENETTGARIYEGEKIPMSIKMGTRNTTADDDEVIKSVRAIVFNDKNELVYNDVSDASINVDNIYIAPIRAARGYNNIYIICNETPELTEKLAAITLENEIEKVTFSAIGIVAPPPMYGNVSRAYVESRSDGTNATVTINNVTTTELPIEVNRMVSRISFTAIKNITNEDEDFKVTRLNVKVCRMPVATTIGEGQAYSENVWSDDLTISGTGELDNNGTYTINGNNYTIPDNIDFITIPTTYIPEHILSDPQNASQATYLKIDAQCVLKNGSTQVLNCIYLLNIGQEPPKNHNLTRNNHYRIYATITGMGAMDVLFKYGSLIAVHSAPTTEDGANFAPPADAETLNDILWYPSLYNPLIIKRWSDVPYLTDGEISTDNTSEQVKQGLGDPCKLAGLSETQIRDMGIIDNGQWHMATPEEYNHIIAASNNETSSYGYFSYHWLLLPHNRYRDESGVSCGNGTTGCYWANNASIFDFSGTPMVTASLQSGKDRQNGYMVRCVRNEIPESRIGVGIIVSPSYQGTEASGNSYFGISSNIPYWTATLVTSGSDMGTATPEDFSFELGDNTVHTTHGSNTQNIHVYVKRKESTSSRSFRVRVEGTGLDGQTKSTLLTIAQAGYQLRASSELSTMGVLPQKGGTYDLNINLSPTDVPIPAGKLYVQVVYNGGQISISDKVETVSNTYSYPISITIPANESPSLIGLTAYIILMRNAGADITLSSLSINQNGTK